MSFVNADQLIFANVEEEQSPRRRRGYQVLYSTQPGLGPRETAEIEARLFYDPGEEDATKWIFFTTSTGRSVIGRVVRIPGQDRFGRTGRCLGHALAFQPQDFERLGDNPFPVFRKFPFFETVESAAACGEFDSGSIPAARLELSSYSETAAQPQCDGVNEARHTRRLLLLLPFAAGADRLHESQLAIGLYGSADAMFETLEDLFQILPLGVRPSCSFDTIFRGGAINRLPYWAVGLPTTHPREPNLYPFDLERGEFLAGAKLEPSSLFEGWLHDALSENHPAKLLEQMDPAYCFTGWLEGRVNTEKLPDDMDDALFRSLIESGRATLRARLQGTLSRQLGPSLGSMLLSKVLGWSEREGSSALPHLKAGWPRRMLLGWIEEAWVQERAAPPAAALQELEKLLGAEAPNLLRLIVWRWMADWNRLTVELRNIDDETFDRFTAWAFRTVPIRAEWRVQRDATQIQFGPIISLDRPEDGETRRLLSTLLDLPDEGQATGEGRRGRTSLFGGHRSPSPAGLPAGQDLTWIRSRRWGVVARQFAGVAVRTV